MPQADLSEEESGRREESRKGKKGKKSNDSQKSGRARMPHENRPAGGMKRGIGGGDRIADGDGLMGWGSQMELEGGRRRLAGLFTAWPDPGAVQLQREPSRRPTRPWTGASSDPPGRRAQSIHPWIPPLSLVRPVGSIGFRLAAQLHQPLRVATRQPAHPTGREPPAAGRGRLLIRRQCRSVPIHPMHPPPALDCPTVGPQHSRAAAQTPTRCPFANVTPSPTRRHRHHATCPSVDPVTRHIGASAPTRKCPGHAS